MLIAQGFKIIIVYIVNGEIAIIGPMLRRIRWKRNADEEHTSEPIKGIKMIFVHDAQCMYYDIRSEEKFSDKIFI